MATPTGGSIAKTKTVPYDVAEHLRTPEEMSAYLAVWLQEAPDDAESIARALGDIARAHRLVQAAANLADPEAAAKSQLEGWRRVYEGLSESEIAEVEAIALDRSNSSASLEPRRGENLISPERESTLFYTTGCFSVLVWSSYIL